MPEADHLDLSHPTGAATEVDSRSYDDLAAEAKAYTWTEPEPEPARQADPRLHPDPRPTSVQLRDTRAERLTAETQRDLAQADADRHLRNARYLGGLLEQFARTLGANPLDLEELPALVDGLRTTTDQLRIKAADHAHALDRAEAGATLWKTRLVRESTQLRDHLAKARLTTARAEARAAAYCLAYDHLDAVTRTLVTTIEAHVSLTPHTAHHILTTADRQRILAARDTVRRVLSRDMESYLAQPYDDITPDTRVDLTPAGHAVASQPTAKPCQPGCGIGYHLQGCPHIGTQLGIAPDGSELAASSVPPVARESVDEDVDYSPAAGRLLGRLMDADLAFINRLGLPDPLAIAIRRHWLSDLAPIIVAEVDRPRLAAQGQAVNATDQVLCDVADEREAQDAKWGEQNHHDGTGFASAAKLADLERDNCKVAFDKGAGTWRHILNEEVAEAYAETDPAKLRVELVQVAAVAVAWAEHIDRRTVEVADRG